MHKNNFFAFCNNYVRNLISKELPNFANAFLDLQATKEIEKGDVGEEQSPEYVLIDKEINFALVCIQITYPLIYNTLLEYPNFHHWGDDEDEASGGVGYTLKKKAVFARSD